MVPSDSAIPDRRPRFRRASLQTGAYELIPLPFVDDWLIARERRRMVKLILSARGFAVEEGAVRILAGSARTMMGRLGSMTKGLLIKPLRKVFRSVFFWLTARRAARTVVTTYFLGRFLHHPDLRPAAGATVTESEARAWAAVFDDASRNLDLRALGEAFRQVRRVMARRDPKELAGHDVEVAIEEGAPDFVKTFDRFVAGRLGARDPA